jgi:hypothetical protein
LLITYCKQIKEIYSICTNQQAGKEDGGDKPENEFQAYYLASLLCVKKRINI